MKTKNVNKLNFVKIYIFFSLIAIGVYIIITFVTNTVSLFNLEYRCFTDIKQFDKLNEYVIEDIDPTEDEYLKELKYVESYTKKISYNNQKYTIYAYVFNNYNDSIIYFKNYSHETWTKKSGFWGESIMGIKSKHIIYNENCIYRIQGGEYNSFVNFVNFVGEDFPISVFCNTGDGSVSCSVRQRGSEC